MSLKIEKKNEGTKDTVMLSGRLDTTTAPELDVFAEKELEDTQELVLDFADLEYISSAGLRVLLKLQKVMNKKGSMKLIHVGEVVKEVFEITGFTDILNNRVTRAVGLAGFRSGQRTYHVRNRFSAHLIKEFCILCRILFYIVQEKGMVTRRDGNRSLGSVWEGAVKFEKYYSGSKDRECG